MAKKSKPDAAPEDELPEGVPDQSFEEKDEAAPKTEAVAEEAEPEEEKVRPVHSKRQDIYKRAKEKTEAEEGSEGEPEPRLSPYAPEPEVAASDAPAEEEPAPEPKKIKLKVNGQEIEKTEEEVAAAARQHFAAEDRLPDIKQLRNELHGALAEIRNLKDTATRSDASAHPADRSAADTEPEASPKAPGLDPKRIRDVLEKIRLGDGDEGVEEFSSLLNEAAAARPPEAPAQSREELVAATLQALRSEAATQAFASKHQDVFSDVRLSRLATMELADLCLDEFRQIGVSEPDMVYLAQNPGEAIKFHKKWREEGWQGLSQPEELGEKAITNVQSYRPAPTRQAPTVAQNGQSRTEARTQEKRTDLQNQPRRANAVARQAPQEPKTRPEVVSGIRAMRGFRSN